VIYLIPFEQPAEKYDKDKSPCGASCSKSARTRLPGTPMGSLCCYRYRPWVAYVNSFGTACRPRSRAVPNPYY